MAGTPIKITFYNPDDSVNKEYSKLRLPLGLVDVAFDLLSQVDKEEVTKESWDGIKAFLVEAFGNQFTLDELNKGADLGEIMAVFESIIARISITMPKATVPNPTPPGMIPRGQKRH